MVGNDTTVDAFFSRSCSDSICACSVARGFVAVSTIFFSFPLRRGPSTRDCSVLDGVVWGWVV